MEIDRINYEEDIQEENIKKEKIFSIGDLLNKKVKKNTRITNQESALADDIYKHWNKKLSFPMIRKFIKENGFQCVYEIFQESKDKGIGLFIWLNNKNRTKFK